MAAQSPGKRSLAEGESAAAAPGKRAAPDAARAPSEPTKDAKEAPVRPEAPQPPPRGGGDVSCSCVKATLHGVLRRHGPNKVPTPFALEMQRRVHALVPVVGDIATTTMQVVGLMERIENEKEPNREHRPWTKDRVLQIMYGVCEGGDKSHKERMVNDAALGAKEEEEETDHAPPAAKEDKNTCKRKATHLSKEEKDAEVLKARRVRREHYDPLRNGLEMPALSREGVPGHALEEIANLLAASINTNISRHFPKHLQRYWRVAKENGAKPPTRAEAYKRWTRVRSMNEQEVSELKDDMLPRVLDGTVAQTLEKHPERFLAALWRMNAEFIKRGMKAFAVMPLPRRLVPGANLHLDSEALVQLMRHEHWISEESDDEVLKEIARALDGHKRRVEERRTKEGKARAEAKPPAGYETIKRHVGMRIDVPMLEEKDELWSLFFDLSTVARRSKSARERFAGHITTDGVSVSVELVHAPSGGFPNGPALFRLEKQPSRPAAGSNDGAPAKKQRVRRTKEEMEQERAEQNAATQARVLDHMRKYGVAPESLVIVGCDPGKHVLVLLTTACLEPDKEGKGKKKSGKTLSYSAAQRREESGGQRRNAMEAACRPKRVEEALKLFEGTNSRATSSEEFKKYVLAHLKVQAQTRVFWCKPQRRIVRWQNWKGRRSADDRFVERVVETFGAGAVIAYGSAAGWHAMKGHAPTPTTGLRRRMEVRPELLVIKTPEALTTKTCCRCVQQTLGPDRQRMTTTTNRSGVDKSFPARGIRRCNSASCEGRRWKRDLNAAINIRRNLLHYLADGCWIRFRQPLPGENAEDEDEDEDESDDDDDGAAPQAVAPQPPAAAQQAPANTGASLARGTGLRS